MGLQAAQRAGSISPLRLDGWQLLKPNHSKRVERRFVPDWHRGKHTARPPAERGDKATIGVRRHRYVEQDDLGVLQTANRSFENLGRGCQHLRAIDGARFTRFLDDSREQLTKIPSCLAQGDKIPGAHTAQAQLGERACQRARKAWQASNRRKVKQPTLGRGLERGTSSKRLGSKPTRRAEPPGCERWQRQLRRKLGVPHAGDTEQTAVLTGDRQRNFVGCGA